jgi:hypothetical protein
MSTSFVHMMSCAEVSRRYESAAWCLASFMFLGQLILCDYIVQWAVV